MSHSKRKMNIPVKPEYIYSSDPPLNPEVVFDIFQKLMKEKETEEEVKEAFRVELLNYVLLHGIDKEYKKEIDSYNEKPADT